MTTVESLPDRFPIFPLAGCLLLPGGNLPLNIFEPRYLQMVRDAMKTDRIIGMIQPRAQAAEHDARSTIYDTGCAGQIANYRETNDGRILITLSGVCRFTVLQELDTATPYRQVHADFTAWRSDLQPEDPPETMKTELLGSLRSYFQRQEIEADWDALHAAPLLTLITSLSMICPFEDTEKQALIEAKSTTGQGKLLIALMRMAAAGDTGDHLTRH